MKKRLLVLGMIACLFGLTACGNNESAQVLTEEEEAAAQVADSYISQIAQIEADGTADQYIAYDESLEGVFSSWESGMEDLGGYVETTGHDVDLSDNKEVVVNVDITGSALDPKGQPRTATVEVIYTAKDYKLSSLDEECGTEYCTWYGYCICDPDPDQPDHFMFQPYSEDRGSFQEERAC